MFSFMAERKNPPIGNFIECEGGVSTSSSVVIAQLPCVVLFHGNGLMIQDLIITCGPACTPQPGCML